MKIVMLVTNNGYDDPRVRSEAEALAQEHEVVVVGWDRRGDGADKIRAGVRYEALGSSLGMRLRAADLFRLPGWRARAVDHILAHHADAAAVHCHDLDTLAAGVRLNRGRRLVFDAHEVWPDMVAKDLPAPFVAYFRRAERRLVPQADTIITVSNRLEEHYAQYGVPIVQVLNAKASRRYRRPADRVATYIGTLNRSRLSIELASLQVPGWQVRIGGVGRPDVVRRVEVAAKRSGNTWWGRVPPEEVLDRTQDAMVVLSPFDPADAQTRVGFPNKLFEALACGRAVLATKGTFLGDFVTAHGIGVATDFRAGAVAKELQADHDWVAMGRRAHALGKGPYGQKAQTDALLAVYR